MYALAKLEAEKENNGWRTMESAPKDGTAILGFDGLTDMATIRWFQRGIYPGYWTLIAVGAYAEDGEWGPILWQPLPDPPNK